MVQRRKKRNNNRFVVFGILGVIAVVLILVIALLGGKETSKEPTDIVLMGETSGEVVSSETLTVETTTAEPTTEETTTEEETTTAYEVNIAGITVMSDVTELDISGTIVDDLDAFRESLSQLYNLTYIDMCDCGVPDEEMGRLREDFPNIKFVWRITMAYWSIRTDAVAFSTLKDGTITYRLTNDDIQPLKYCTDMVALDLGHNKVTDISFLQYMPELKILILVDDWKGETAEHYISDLSMLKYCPKLMYLEFFVGDVSDLSFLEYTPNMVDLNVSYNPITDVSYLLNLPKIERLYIEHTGLTDADYNLLKETYPDAYIVYYGEGSVDQGWRTHDRYFAMIDMYHNNYVHELFAD